MVSDILCVRIIDVFAVESFEEVTSFCHLME
jgi:hypothetical protein